MTPAIVLAMCAGVCAAAAIVGWFFTDRIGVDSTTTASTGRGGPASARGQRGGASAGDVQRGQRGAASAAGHLAGMTVLLARLGRRLRPRTAPGDLVARIAAAGAPLDLSAGDVLALKGAFALGALLAAAPVASALPGRLGVVALLAGPAAGFFAPDVALRRLARRRGARIADELADVLDLLRVAIAAGLPVGRAMGEVGRRMSGILAGELDGAAARIQLGVSRAEALRTLVSRCPSPGVATLAAAVARADLHGAALAPTLAALATEARAEQARRLRDRAARAAPKIQLVVALILVPAVMLLVGAVLVQGVAGSG